MAKYIYSGRDNIGKIIKGFLDANNKDDAITKLQVKGITVTFLELEAKKSNVFDFMGSQKKLHNRVKIDDMILFGRQLSTLLDSGVTLLKSLEIIIKQVESQQLLIALVDIKRAIERGEPFSKALKAHKKIFSEFWINLVETGEASGHLPTSLEQLVAHMESVASLRRKVIGAMYYPAILVFVSFIAIIVFLTYVIPIFSKIFEGFNMELPVLTQNVIMISYCLKKYFFVLLSGCIVLCYSIFMGLKTRQGKRMRDIMFLFVPVINTIIVQMQSSRFASGLGTLLKSGVPILHALEIVAKTSGNILVEDALDNVKIAIRDGKNMADPLEETGVFPVMVTQMVAVGEEIGELGKMLDRVAEFYEERLNSAVEKLTTLIEPTILIFVGTIIGVLVISMFLPIFKISNIS